MRAPLREVLRVLDANYNRLTEAWRVIEDHFRFGEDNPALSSSLKNLRHGLQSAFELAGVSREDLLSARDIVRDVGTSTKVENELSRKSVGDLLVANYRRAAEALRVIEEYSKTFDPRLASSVEKIRYEFYELELAGLLDHPKKKRLEESRLCLLATSAMVEGNFIETVEAAIEGGVDMVQLREKETDDAHLLKLADDLASLCKAAEVIFIINDRPDIALLSDADGVHVGQEDLPPAAAIALLGRGKIVGVSTHSKSEMEKALADGADYVGVGPVFSTSTTQKVGPGKERALLQELLPLATVPAFCIGGITPENIQQAVEWGAQRVAVSAGILKAKDPERAAKIIRDALQSSNI